MSKIETEASRIRDEYVAKIREHFPHLPAEIQGELADYDYQVATFGPDSVLSPTS